jgi:NitT/TauT family transport system substrate-binding protein
VRLLAVLAASVLAFASAAAADPMPVVIGVSSRSFNPGFSNMWIGIPLGLYGPNLAPEALGTQGASENLQLMLAGKVTMSTGTQDVVLNAMAQGRSLPVVAPCVALRGIRQRVSVLPDSPIRTYEDLRGRRLGVPTLASGYGPYIRYAARSAGLDPAALNIVAVGDGQSAAAALTSGRIDALVNGDVDVAALQEAGVALRVVSPPQSLHDAAVGYTFAFRRDWYDQHKPAVVDMLQGMIKAIIVMLENPQAAVAISYYMHPEAIPGGLSRDQAILRAVQNIRVRAPLIERDVGASHRWCEFPAATWKNYVDMIGLPEAVDAMKFYDPQLLEKINDFDEPAVRTWARSLQVPPTEAGYKEWLRGLRAP